MVRGNLSINREISTDRESDSRRESNARFQTWLCLMNPWSLGQITAIRAHRDRRSYFQSTRLQIIWRKSAEVQSCQTLIQSTKSEPTSLPSWSLRTSHNAKNPMGPKVALAWASNSGKKLRIFQCDRRLKSARMIFWCIIAIMNHSLTPL